MRAPERAPSQGGEVIRKSRFVAATAMALALGVATLAWADGASENDAGVMGKVTPAKLDKKKWKFR